MYGCVYGCVRARLYRFYVTQNREPIEYVLRNVIRLEANGKDGCFQSNTLNASIFNVRRLLFVLMQTYEANGEKKLIRIDIKEMAHSILGVVCWADADAKAQNKENEKDSAINIWYIRMPYTRHDPCLHLNIETVKCKMRQRRRQRRRCIQFSLIQS